MFNFSLQRILPAALSHRKGAGEELQGCPLSQYTRKKERFSERAKLGGLAAFEI